MSAPIQSNSPEVCRLLEQIGLDPDDVAEVIIRIKNNDVVTMQIVRYVDHPSFEVLTEFFRFLKLERKPEP